jgi:hypothetical protein
VERLVVVVVAAVAAAVVLHNQRLDRTQDRHHTHRPVDPREAAEAVAVGAMAQHHYPEDHHSRRSCHRHERHWPMEEVQVRHGREIHSRRDRIDLVARELQRRWVVFATV